MSGSGAIRRRFALLFSFVLAVLLLQAAAAAATEPAEPVGTNVEIGYEGPAIAMAGGTVTYTITASNTGPRTATGEVIRDFPGMGLTVTAMTIEAGHTGACRTAPAGCTVAAIPAGETARVTVTATIAGDAPTTVYNRVTGTAPGDPDANGGCASVTTLEACDDKAEGSTAVRPVADVDIGLTGPSGTAAGSTFSYAIVARNNGPADAGGALVRDFPGAGYTIADLRVEAPHAGTCQIATVPFGCIVNAIPAGQTAIVTVTVRVEDGTIGTLTSRASVTNPYDPDPDAGCGLDTTFDTCADGAALDTTVTPVADVELTAGWPSAMNAGDAITYSISAFNAGPSTAVGEVVHAVPGAGLSVGAMSVSTPYGGTCTTTAPFGCAIAAIPKGETAVVTVTAAIAPDAAGSVSASATGTNPADPDPEADIATVGTAIRPKISIDDAAVAEGGPDALAGAVFTVSLDTPPQPGETVSVHYAVTDRDNTNGTVTFTGSETSKQVTVGVPGDGVDEPDETFLVRLDSPGNASILDGEGLGTVTDDDRDGTLSCRATGLRVQLPAPPEAQPALPENPCADGATTLPKTDAEPGAVAAGIFAASGPVTSVTDQAPDDLAAAPAVGDQAVSTVHVEKLGATVGLDLGVLNPALAMVSADGLGSAATARCDAAGDLPVLTGSSVLSNVKVGGQVIVDAKGKVRKASNVTVDADGGVRVEILGVGTLHLNSRTVEGGTVTQRALWLQVDLPDIADLVVSEARAGFQGNPCAA